MRRKMAARRKTEKMPQPGEQLMEMLGTPTSDEEWKSFDKVLGGYLGAQKIALDVMTEEEQFLAALREFVIEHGIKGASQFPEEAILYRGTWKLHNAPEVQNGKVVYKLLIRDLSKETCSTCSEKIESGQRFCASCGHKLEEQMLPKSLAA